MRGWRVRQFFWLAPAALAMAGAAQADGPTHGKLSAVPFTEVKFQDVFWRPRLETNREKSLPHNILWCEQTGRIANFAKAGKLMAGNREGAHYNDSDVFKVVEGVSYSLSIHPDPALEKTLDAIISEIAAAQQPDGYLNTYYTLVEPDKRWKDLSREPHELYCAGHLIEAAVAHYRATAKRTLLDVAIKYADCIDNRFGPTKGPGLYGHPELELALVRLYDVTGEKRYLDLAKFLVDTRGKSVAQGGQHANEFLRDSMPLGRQKEIVNHAVRAMYLCCGAADVAAHTGDRQLIDALDGLWRDMVLGKMYVTGGIGARHGTEAFGAAYELPNDTAYCETCAAIGLAFWAHRMNLLYGDAAYVDVLERGIYNGILSGVGLDGTHFFYVNPMAMDAGQHGFNSNFTRHRQPFFSCACCPTNVVRFLPSLPGYAYATDEDGVYVNLYAAGRAKIPHGESAIGIVQETKYPWDGNVKLTVEPQKPCQFGISLRIPGWCEGAKLAINGAPVDPLDLNNGYVRLRRQWRAGDVIQLELPMPIRRIEAHPRVQADVGRVAVQRGPIVYCFEGIDNGGHAKDIVLARDPGFVASHRDDLLGGVTMITGVAEDGRKAVAVPYYAWDQREPGEMIVWARQDGKQSDPKPDNPTWQGKLYRPYEPRREVAASAGTINAAVVTGGHPFNEPEFLKLFQGHDGVSCKHLPQKAGGEVFENVADWPYDVIVLYNYERQITPKQQENFLKLLDKGVGLVILHHANDAYHNWPEYAKIAGVEWHDGPWEQNGKKMPASGWKNGIKFKIHVADPNHPITHGLKDYDFVDETYCRTIIDPSVHVLLTTDEPSSDRIVGWTKTYRKSKVCYLQSGHDTWVYNNPNYRTLVIRAIRWTIPGGHD